jgi:hypothetical protein
VVRRASGELSEATVFPAAVTVTADARAVAVVEQPKEERRALAGGIVAGCG